MLQESHRQLKEPLKMVNISLVLVSDKIGLSDTEKRSANKRSKGIKINQQSRVLRQLLGGAGGSNNKQKTINEVEF
jgi:hypothetical protein